MLHALGNYSAKTFLADYWQQRPLYIPAALAQFQNPLSPDELAGLACEEFIESRLILGPEIQGAWQLTHGPFTEATLTNLPASHWTLHVQGVENLLREAYQLFDYFRFLPNWRLEDIMVSYAPDQGSAGPHYDQYDVFLIQTLGNKRWRLGGLCDANTPLLDDTDGLRLVKNFDNDLEFVAKPGDILYIPPGIAHFGIAEGESITYSVGFRAPSAAELCLSAAQDLTESALGEQRYSDVDRRASPFPGLLNDLEIKRLRDLLSKSIDQLDASIQFGKLLTQPKQELAGFDDELKADMSLEEFAVRAATQDKFYWQLGSRFCYTESANGLNLFVNGEVIVLSPNLLSFIRAVTACTEIDIASLSLEDPEALQTLFRLYQNNWLLLE